jgi:hypothetical protein
MKRIAIACGLVVTLGSASLARGDLLRIGFEQVTDPKTTPIDTSAQYSLLVGQSRDGTVNFILRNLETIAPGSSITGVALIGRHDFDTSSVKLLESDNVQFAADTVPQRLSGLLGAPFASVSSKSESGLFPSGLNSPDEALVVRFRPNAGVQFSDIRSELADKALRVAIRVQNITAPDAQATGTSGVAAKAARASVVAPQATDLANDPPADFSAVFVSQPFAEVTAVPLPAVAPACAAMFGIGMLWCVRARGRLTAKHSRSAH